MPRPLDRRGHLVAEEEFEEQKEREREARIARFVQRAGPQPTARDPRAVQMLGQEEWEPPETVRSHDPHTLEATRARLVEAMNSRG